MIEGSGLRPLGVRFDAALVYAAEAHRRQFRKGTTIPYVTHLLAVAAIVGENHGDEDMVIAALLHDAVEDQGGQARLDDIRSRFGEAVAAIVWGCTDADATPKPPWRERKEVYVAHLADAPEGVLLVSSADKLHNARAILADLRLVGEGVWARFTGGKDGSLWYYRALTEAYQRYGRGHAGVAAIAGELARVVGEIERLASVGDSGD